ncbi:VOC family protein [Pseudooceanicola sp. 200-1SW]|uniref:VOC family protein n=1 Tax=Pseudooceanicola sp. 200-1SW TaxID=3425949 RepID=UPI003D7FB5C4
MISHVTLAVADFDRALAFWRALMACLGHEESWLKPGEEASFRAPGHPRPLLFLVRPFAGAPDPGNGPMLGLMAADRATVHAAHALALRLGGQDEGAPGLRPQYHADFYGAYFRDSEGNKICVVCHEPEGFSAA